MKNLVNDFNLIKEGERTALRALSIEIATKDGAKSHNNNGKLGLAIAYIITQLAATGQMKDTKREEIELGSTASKKDVNSAVKKLVDKGLVKKYKKVNQVVTTGKFRFDKYVYTLIATVELVDMIEAKGYTVSFDKSILRKLQTTAASETEKVTSVIKVDENGVASTEKTTTDARGNRTKTIAVDMNSVERALDNAREEYENKVAGITAVAEQDGRQEELSPVQPLVSKEDIFNMDIEEFKAEQQQEEEIIEEEHVDEIEEIIEPQPEVEEAPIVTPEVIIEDDKEVVYHNNQVKRSSGKKLTSRKQGNLDGYGNIRKPRNLNNEKPKGYTNHYAKNTNVEEPAFSKDDTAKAIKWLEKINSGEWNERNLKPDQITRIYETWKSMNNGKVPTNIEKLYNEMILGIK